MKRREEVRQREEEADQDGALIIGLEAHADRRDLARHEVEPHDEDRGGADEQNVAMLIPCMGRKGVLGSRPRDAPALRTCAHIERSSVASGRT
jgi:hypothetical protein